MTDENTNAAVEAANPAPPVAVEPDEVSAEAVAPEEQIVAQEPKLVGDEAVAEEAESPYEGAVNDEPVARQVAQPREAEPETVPVHETTVVTDRVITDTSDPLAVQVPDAGRGDASTPIQRAFSDAEHVEDVFAREASEPDEDDS